MIVNKFIIFTFGILFVQSLKHNRNYNIVIDHIDCKATAMCPEPVCSLTTVKRYEKIVTAGCNFTEPTSFTGFLTYNIKRNGIYRPMMIDNLELDFCAYYEGDRLNAFIHLLASMKSFREHTSLIVKCPYKGFAGINGWLVESSAFPDFIPPGQYRLDAKGVHKNGTLIMIGKLYCEIKPKTAFLPDPINNG